MTQQHPITPPPELVQQWSDEALTASGVFEVKMQFATRAAQWGADQELEACCEWIDWHHSGRVNRELRAARRPERLNRSKANSNPTPNPSQIRSSLVERVSCAIDGRINPDQWLHQDAARAAIREVLAYLREHELIGSYAQGQLNAELRRPKPPSLKEQGMTDLIAAYNDDKIDDTTYENIRRALEQLPDNE